MNKMEEIIRECLQDSKTRNDFWIKFLSAIKVNSLIELGVYKGNFAEVILKEVGSIKSYYMLDPWRHLEDWNKPANKKNDIFEQFFSEAMQKTSFAADKRIVLRGKTTEKIDEIADSSLDFAYVDGDHTLRGITIDLVRVYPKIKDG